MILKEGENNSLSSFFVRYKNELHRVTVDEIVYMKSDRNYSVIYLNDYKYAVKVSLKRLIDKLPTDKFIRIHHSYVVALDRIKKINVGKSFLSVQDEDLPLGKRYKTELLERINQI